MLEISGDDIVRLGDADLRDLVLRLAIAELRKNGLPISSVTAGGNQDAADGGLDVRVECPVEIVNPDFVPRRVTGFQVKKPDMSVRAIHDEMRPKNILRDVIRELAEVSGAYVIVSAQGSVADKPLANRRRGMRNALHDIPNGQQLHTDFYDRDRLANWVNEYPGIAAWVRIKVGRPLSGWSGISAWPDVGDAQPYLCNDRACLVDERSKDREHLTLAEGIARLRTALRVPKQCIRLVGLSGLGKTRLVQALFEEEVGEDPLDPSLAVYTNYSEETNPTARGMAHDLVIRGQRAILIIDNCNPSTHSDLVRLCASNSSQISLITIEYDVQDEEPERTEVFRLRSVSSDLVAQWLKQSFPNVSQVDREKIAEFSDGNFRVAGALADTLRKGETLGSLKSRELFSRIFQQRNEPDQNLLRAAEDLSLLYSIDGEDLSPGSELNRIAAIRNLDIRLLYEALVKLRRRGVVQSRGRFRAILPQAIANPLAAHALERISPQDFDCFCAALTPRMRASASRRLGFLHDSTDAQVVVARWLHPDGPLGNLLGMGREGLQIITNIAPVAPETALAMLEREIDGPASLTILAPGAPRRDQWIRLIKMLGYDAPMFERALILLARFLATEPDGHNLSSARAAFSGFFRLYLSGTQATPDQRRAAVRRLAISEDAQLRLCASVALEGLLEANHYMSTGSFDFGARSRDWGWQPTVNKDVWEWFSEAVAMAVDLATAIPDAPAILARNARSLCRYEACHDALDRAATVFSRERPWIDGWLAFRGALRFEGEEMPAEFRSKIERIIARLKPSDLLNQARAVVLKRGHVGWDFADGEEDDGDAIQSWEKADRMAVKVGRRLASDSATRRMFLPELLSESQAPRAFECGRGLAEGAASLEEMWRDLTEAYSAVEAQKRNSTVLGGFLHEAHKRDKTFAAPVLEAAIYDPALASKLPYLQARVDLAEEGIARLRRAIAQGALAATDFSYIANGSVSNSPPDPLGTLLLDIATLPNGVGVALEILHMHLYRKPGDGENRPSRLIEIGRELLARADYGDMECVRDYGMANVIRVCLTGEDGRNTAQTLCATIRSTFESTYIPAHEMNWILGALFGTHPFIALDVFLLPEPVRRHPLLFDSIYDGGTALEELDPMVLRRWADRDPDRRYPQLGKCISMFGSKDGDEENEISPTFLLLLGYAPDKRLFLGDFWSRLHPRSWSGSLADILVQRKMRVVKLAEHSDDQVREWVAKVTPELDSFIDCEREREREREESFE
jgi:hypothetical protein